MIWKEYKGGETGVKSSVAWIFSAFCIRHHQLCLFIKSPCCQFCIPDL